MCAPHPGGVHDHVIDAGERARVATREPAGRVESSVVRRERSAAALLTGHDHAPAVAGQHADRGAVDLVEPPVLHAPGEHGDGSADLDTGRRVRGPRQPGERRRALRRERAHAARQERPGDRLEERRGPQQRGMGEHDVQPEPPQEPRAPGPERFHLHARVLHHPAERHVRRTDVLARATHQAQVHERSRTCRRPRPFPRRPNAWRRSVHEATPTPRRSAGTSGSGGGTGRTPRTTRGRHPTARPSRSIRAARPPPAR